MFCMGADVSSNNKIYGGSMKNFVIATVSAVALLGAAAHADEKSPEMKEIQNPAQEKIAEVQSAPHVKHHKHHAHHKHHGHHKHHKHHKHHGHHGHMHQGHPLAVYVNYPLVNVAAFCARPCEYYEGFPYVWHEGYFWYPHEHGEMFVGYTPPYVRGSYWYPSRLHPHMVYVDKHDMMPHEIYPVPMGSHEGAMHMHKHKHHHAHQHPHHMAKVKHHAKAMPMGEVQPAAAQPHPQPQPHPQAMPMEATNPAAPQAQPMQK